MRAVNKSDRLIQIAEIRGVGSGNCRKPGQNYLFCWQPVIRWFDGQRYASGSILWCKTRRLIMDGLCVYSPTLR